MRIVINCRFPKDKTQEEIDEFKEELSLEMLIDSEMDERNELANFMEKDIQYEYVPVSIDLLDVGTFNPLDSTHTVVRTTTSGSYTAKIEFEAFLNAYEDLTGYIIKDLRNVVLLKVVSPDKEEDEKDKKK